MTEKKATLNLYQKLSAVMGGLENIPKEGYNSFYGYKYVKESTVAEAVRKLLLEHGVFLVTSVVERVEREIRDEENGKASTLVTVTLEHRFVNIDNPEDTFVAHSVGDGIDRGDKGIYKAITGAVKYFLMKTFSLGSDDDAEGDTETDANAEKRATSAAAVTTSSRRSEPVNRGAASGGRREFNDPPMAEILSLPFSYRFWEPGGLNKLANDGGAFYAKKAQGGDGLWHSQEFIPELGQYLVGGVAQANAAAVTVSNGKVEFAGGDEPPF